MARNKLLQVRAYERLRERLFQGNMPYQRRLSHRTLANELKVSLGSIRVALDRLEGEGLVECLPQSGIRLRRVSVREYHEIHDLRQLIEPYAARRAARWISPAQLDKLTRACDDYAQVVAAFERCSRLTVPAELLKRALKAENDFHGTILKAARNTNAIRIAENLRLIGYMASAVPLRERGSLLTGWQRGEKEHRRITEALARNDADEAERLMREHLRLGPDDYPANPQNNIEGVDDL